MASSPKNIRRCILCLILIAGVFLPGVSVARPKPHVWLHYDYLVYPDGRTEAPDPLAIQNVVDAYAVQGILLEIDPDHTAIPTSNPAVDLDTMNPSCPGSLSFSALKEQYFRNRSPHDWHYVIFAGDATTILAGCTSPISGIAELPGDDFIIGMNNLRVEGPAKELQERRFTAGTFMHELGHNLGLRHGGNDDYNGKPNHISVMNYNYQLAGVFSLTPEGKGGVRVDYSTGLEGASLDSMHLNENVGLGVESNDFTRFLIDCDDCFFGLGFGPARGPIDWNLNGDETESDVAVKFITVDGQPLPRFISGFDEWSAIRKYLASILSSKQQSVVHKDVVHPVR